MKSSGHLLIQHKVPEHAFDSPGRALVISASGQFEHRPGAHWARLYFGGSIQVSVHGLAGEPWELNLEVWKTANGEQRAFGAFAAGDEERATTLPLTGTEDDHGPIAVQLRAGSSSTEVITFSCEPAA